MERAETRPRPAPTAQERRRAFRQTLITKAMLYRDDRAAGPRRVKVKNVSLTGVGLESDSPIDVNTFCRLHIEAGPARLTWRLRIAACGKLDNGSYYVGGQFLTSELIPSADDSEPDSLPSFP